MTPRETASDSETRRARTPHPVRRESRQASGRTAKAMPHAMRNGSVTGKRYRKRIYVSATAPTAQTVRLAIYRAFSFILHLRGFTYRKLYSHKIFLIQGDT